MLLRNYAVESLYIDQCYLSLVLESAVLKSALPDSLDKVSTVINTGWGMNFCGF